MCVQPTISAQIRQGDKVHFLGDSLTSAGVQWFLPLETLINAAVDEHGTPMSVTYTSEGTVGDTLTNITANIATDLQAFNPDFLIFQIGRNDYGVTAGTYTGSWRAFFAAALAWKPTLRMLVIGPVWAGEVWAAGPVWNNPTTDADSLTINTATAAAARASSIAYCDARAAALASMPTNNPGQLSAGAETTDGTHPNATGKTVMCAAVFSSLTFHS